MVDRIFDSRLSANERTAAMVSGGGNHVKDKDKDKVSVSFLLFVIVIVKYP